LAQWDTSVVVPLANGRSKLSLLAELDVDQAFSVLGAAVGEAVPTLTASTGLRMSSDAALVVESRAVISFAQDAVEHRKDEGTRTMLTLAARDLQPLLDTLLDDFLGANLACAEGKDATTLRCGARILAGAVYAPVMQYLATPNPTEADRQRLSRE